MVTDAMLHTIDIAKPTLAPRKSQEFATGTGSNSPSTGSHERDLIQPFTAPKRPESLLSLPGFADHAARLRDRLRNDGPLEVPRKRGSSQ